MTSGNSTSRNPSANLKVMKSDEHNNNYGSAGSNSKPPKGGKDSSGVDFIIKTRRNIKITSPQGGGSKG